VSASPAPAPAPGMFTRLCHLPSLLLWFHVQFYTKLNVGLWGCTFASSQSFKGNFSSVFFLLYLIVWVYLLLTVFKLTKTLSIINSIVGMINCSSRFLCQDVGFGWEITGFIHVFLLIVKCSSKVEGK